MQQRQPHRVEEGADLGIERGAARDQRLDPPAEALADLGPQRARQHHIHRQVAQPPLAPRRLRLADRYRAVHQVGGEAALLLDLLHDPGAQHFEQPRDHDHDRRTHLLDVTGQLLQSLGVMDAAAQRDRQELAAGVLVGMAQGQEREEHLIVPAEILGDDPRRAVDVAQDHAVVLHHPARRAAGAAGVDDAGEVLAPDSGDPRLDRGARRISVAFEQRGPVVIVEAARLLDMARRHADHVLHLIGAQHRGEERLCEPGVGHDHRPRTRILQDMKMVALGVGRIGGHGDAARGHDRQVGDAPFGAVFGDQHHAVAGVQSQSAQRFGHQAHPPRDLGPAQRLPGPLALGQQHRLVVKLVGAGEEQGDQIGAGVEIGKLHA